MKCKPTCSRGYTHITKKALLYFNFILPSSASISTSTLSEAEITLFSLWPYKLPPHWPYKLLHPGYKVLPPGYKLLHHGYMGISCCTLKNYLIWLTAIYASRRWTILAKWTKLTLFLRKVEGDVLFLSKIYCLAQLQLQLQLSWNLK